MLSGTNGKLVAICCALFVIQQFSGINAIVYFSSSVFRQAGLQSEALASAAVGVINVVGSAIAASLMDKQAASARWSGPRVEEELRVGGTRREAGRGGLLCLSRELRQHRWQPQLPATSLTSLRPQDAAAAELHRAGPEHAGDGGRPRTARAQAFCGPRGAHRDARLRALLLAWLRPGAGAALR